MILIKLGISNAVISSISIVEKLEAVGLELFLEGGFVLVLGVAFPSALHVSQLHVDLLELVHVDARGQQFEQGLVPFFVVELPADGLIGILCVPSQLDASIPATLKLFHLLIKLLVLS